MRGTIIDPSSAPGRWALRTLAPYLILGTLWAVFAYGVAPGIIEAAREGRSLAPFNRVLAGRDKPVGHYLRLWRDFAGAVLIAGGLHLALSRGGDRAFGAFAAAFLAMTVLAGARHDYVADLEIWDVVLSGGDPWWLPDGRGYPLNAYGPLFNAIAPLTFVNPLAPKLLFAAAYVAFVARLARGRGGALRPILMVNPLPWVEVAYFGHFDVLVGLACVAAVGLRVRGRDGPSGIVLGAGVLLKYLPIVLLPFLATEGRKVRPRALGWAGATVGLGLAASVLIWGDSTFRPLAFAATRGSNLLSIFRSLRGTYSPLRLVADAPDLDRLSLPCMALAGGAVWLWCRSRRVGPAPGAFLAVATTLLFYRVGFVQYQMVSFLLVADWAARDPGRFASDRMLRPSLLAFFGWLALFDLFYAAIGGIIPPGGRFGWVDDLAGLPTFGLGLWTIVATIGSLRSRGTVEPEE